MHVPQYYQDPGQAGPVPFPHQQDHRQVPPQHYTGHPEAFQEVYQNQTGLMFQESAEHVMSSDDNGPELVEQFVDPRLPATAATPHTQTASASAATGSSGALWGERFSFTKPFRRWDGDSKPAILRGGANEQSPLFQDNVFLGCQEAEAAYQQDEAEAQLDTAYMDVGALRAASSAPVRRPNSVYTTLVWCEADVFKESGQPFRQELQTLEYAHVKPYKSADRFTRWLFKQPRGCSWCVLLCGWREAKPCVNSVAAARTGRYEMLTTARPEKLHPLMPPHNVDGKVDPSGETVQCAIAHTIVLTSPGRQYRDAAKWCRAISRAHAPVHIVQDLEEAKQLLTALRLELEASGHGPPRPGGGGDEAQSDGSDGDD